MSQLKNIVQVFQNNDLVTAAKLNALVNQTTITEEVITTQAAASAAFAGDDYVLAYEAATGTLVKVDIDTIRATGIGPVKTTDIENLGDNDLTITENGNIRTLRLRSTGVSGSMVLETPNGQMTLATSHGTRSAFSRVFVSNGPFVVHESMEGVGQIIGANMTATIGSPVVSFATTGNHGLTSTEIIEIVGPTAEFSGVYPVSVNGTGTFLVTFPINATVGHSGTPVGFRRPTLRIKELTYLNRLQVVGASKFVGLANFTSPPQYNGADIKPRYDYFVQTRDNTVFTSNWGGAQNPSNLYGTKITPLDITFTPKKAGNTVVLEWSIFGETTYSADTVIVVTRTPLTGAGAGVAVALPNSVDAGNNTWSGVCTFGYDNNDGTTPSQSTVKIVDFNSLDVACTYSVHFRGSNNRVSTFHLNRPVAGIGGVDYEMGLSVGHAYEIYV
jgi:hypothetical protein